LISKVDERVSETGETVLSALVPGRTSFWDDLTVEFVEKDLDSGVYFYAMFSHETSCLSEVLRSQIIRNLIREEMSCSENELLRRPNFE
jgi:hypothetical protein